MDKRKKIITKRMFSLLITVFLIMIPVTSTVSASSNIVPSGISLGFSSPVQVEGKSGTIFKTQVALGASGLSNAKGIDAHIEIPSNLEVVDVKATNSIGNGNISFHVENNQLRFAYINAYNQDIKFYPSNAHENHIFTIVFRLKETLPTGTNLHIRGIESTYKISSTQGYYFNMNNTDTIVINESEISVYGRELYRGENNSLIPTNLKAVAFQFIGLPASKIQPQINYKSKTLYYSQEFTDMYNIITYVGIIDSYDDDYTNNGMDHFNIKDTASENIKFGDTNEDNWINAQDSLNVLSKWLRKTSAPTEKEILIMNVVADRDIDTFDVIHVNEHINSYWYHTWNILTK